MYSHVCIQINFLLCAGVTEMLHNYTLMMFIPDFLLRPPYLYVLQYSPIVN